MAVSPKLSHANTLPCLACTPAQIHLQVTHRPLEPQEGCLPDSTEYHGKSNPVNYPINYKTPLIGTYLVN